MDTQHSGEKARRNRRWLFFSLLPAVALFIVLTAFPVINLLGLSLFHVEWREGAANFNFVGTENFRRLFVHEDVFWAGVRNNVVFAVAAVAFQMILGFSMALAVKTTGSLGRPLLTAIFLLPIVVPPIVIGTMWRLIMGREFGLANTLLGFLGFGPVDWLGDPDLALASVIFVDVWHWTPFVFLLMLAGLESLDGEVLEAARIDTVTRWQEIRYIIVPMMLPTITITLLFRVILSFKVFDEVFLLTSGGPGSATEVVNFSIYRTFFRQDQVGYGAAMSVVTLFSISLLIIVARAFMLRRALRREGAT